MNKTQISRLPFVISSSVKKTSRIYEITTPIYALPKIVKICHISSHLSKNIDDLFSFIEDNKGDKNLVNICQYGLLPQELWEEKQNKISYFYVQDKLNKLPKNDAKIINDLFKFSNISTIINNQIISVKFRNFISGIYNLDIKYTDFHSGNIMLSDDGQYKLIDFEGFFE